MVFHRGSCLGQHEHLAEQGFAGVVAERKVAARKGVNRKFWQGARKEIIVAVQVEIFAQSNHVWTFLLTFDPPCEPHGGSSIRACSQDSYAWCAQSPAARLMAYGL